jgi:cytoskeletal protein CcmA (bactofilin family)
MTCLTELALSVYADHELSREEAQGVEYHLASCPRCRALVQVLGGENLLISQALRAPVEDSAAAATLASPRSGTWQGLTATLLVAAAVAVPAAWAAGRIPASLEWLSPLSLSGWWTLVFTTIFWFVSRLDRVVSAVDGLFAGSIVLLILAAATALFSHRTARMARAAAAVCSLVVLVHPGSAATVRTRSALVTVAAGEIVDKTLVAAGDEVRIDGTVNGDVIAFARRVEVRGAVKGDLVSFAQSTEVRGNVAGNIFALAQSVDVTGEVNGSLYAGAQSVRLEPTGRVGGELFFGGSFASIYGAVRRSVLVSAQFTTVTGTIDRDLTVYGDRLELGRGARVGGQAAAYVSKAENVTVAQGAVVAGGIQTHLSAPKSRFAQPRYYFWLAAEFLGALLAGCVLIALGPGFFGGAAQGARSAWRSLGLGFVVLVVTPVAVIVAAITVVGIPLALLTLAGYVCALYLTKIVVAGFLGQAVRRSVSATRKDWFLSLLIGLAILTAAFRMPFGIGIAFRFVTLCLGLGALSWQLYKAARSHAA